MWFKQALTNATNTITARPVLLLYALLLVAAKCSQEFSLLGKTFIVNINYPTQGSLLENDEAHQHS